MEKLLNDITAKVAVPQAVQPDWLAPLVDHRDEFAGVGLYSDSAHSSGEVIYKLTLSIAQPRRVVFLECTRARGAAARGVRPYKRYEYNSFSFVTHSRVPWTSRSDIWVIPYVIVAGKEVRAAGEPVPWSVFIRYLRKPVAPTQKKEGGTARSRQDAEILRLVMVEYPWLSEAELLEMLKKHGSPSPQTSVPEPRADPLPCGVLLHLHLEGLSPHLSQRLCLKM